VLEPQSTWLFLLLMAASAGLMWWLVVAKQPVLRVLAACLAFVPAMLFGVAAVNKYYGYYQTWGDAVNDFGNRGVKSISAAPDSGGGSGQQQFDILLGHEVDTKTAAQQGVTINLQVTGAATHITRSVYVFLPPEYFQPQWANYRFPAIELIHGSPGAPSDWLTVLHAPSTLAALITARQADPAVLVMPDANGGKRLSRQCLNEVGVVADETFLAYDVPAFISSTVRVEPPGSAWGIAGYSEGGFCAANLALRHPQRFGFGGVVSGYFQPLPYDRTPARVDPFRGDQALRLRNTPTNELRAAPRDAVIPQFWLAAGSHDTADMLQARYFQELMIERHPDTELRPIPGGHTAPVWRAALPLMYTWMTPRLAQAAQQAGEPQPCPSCLTAPVVPPASPAPMSPPKVAQPGVPAPKGAGLQQKQSTVPAQGRT
jgi:enterochelin esterase-like enzyme